MKNYDSDFLNYYIVNLFTVCFSNTVPIYGQCSKRGEEAETANGGQMEKDGMRKTGKKRQRKTNTEAVRNEENEGEAE